MSGHDELVARAKERAEKPPIPDEWGYRITLDAGESFAGRWRGETVDEQNSDDKGNPRRIFLFWDVDDQPAFSRTYAALAREVDRVKPTVGDRVAIARAGDYTTQSGTGHSYGLEAEPCADPFPETPAAGDGIPF